MYEMSETSILSLNLSSEAISEDVVVRFLEKLETSTSNSSREDILTLLSNPTALKYFKYNVKQYCELHVILCNESKNVNELVDVLTNKSLFKEVVRAADEFYVRFFYTLLPTLLTVASKYVEDETVFQETSNIIQKFVFSQNVKQFECYLTDHLQPKKCSEKHHICKRFFKFIISIYNHENSSSMFRLIFYSFATSYKKFELTYKALIIFINIIGFELKQEFNLYNTARYQAEASLSKSLSILKELLDVVSNLKIVLDQNINNITFSCFVENLLKSVISLTKAPNSVCYGIILKSIEISPLVVESVISDVIIYITLADNSTCKREYEEVMVKILEIYSKLHRIQNFLSKTIPALKFGLENRKFDEITYTFNGDLDSEHIHNVEYKVESMFSKNILNYFTSCIINLASWQVINLFKTLLYHFNVAIEELSDTSENDCCIYVEVLGTLICWLLQSVRVAEHTVASGTVEKFVGGLEELKSVLGKFGTKLLNREHNHSLMKVFLNVCYNWAEIYITLEYYSTSGEIKMQKMVDNNFASCNLTYLHSYLSAKEWCLVSERITNFGEQPCKNIMQKLMIQKWKAVQLFERDISDNITAPIIDWFDSNFHSISFGILTDRFFVDNILNKMPSSAILTFAEMIVINLLNDDTTILKEPHICDSQFIVSGILGVVFSKIAKLLKQKRKYDEVAVRKALCSKILSALPADVFLCSDIERFLDKATDIFISEQSVGLEINDSKIQSYLALLKKFPVIFCTDGVQKLLLLLLFSLHRDADNNNGRQELKTQCESLIISIVQHGKFTLLDIFKSDFLIQMLVEKFERCEDLYFHLSRSIFKNDNAIANFQSGIDYLNKNVEEDNCLKLSVNTLNLFTKIKKTKISANSKELCLVYRSQICQEIVKIVLKRNPENVLIEPYAVVFKIFLAIDKSGELATLEARLQEYVDFCLNNLNDDCVKGSFLLFTTILHNKITLSRFNDDFVLTIWDRIKTMKIKNESFGQYSQLVVLIASQIPKEQFSNIVRDLLKRTKVSSCQKDATEFFQLLKMWSCIFSQNTVKGPIVLEHLEYLLEHLVLSIKREEYKEDLFKEVVNFEVSIIQANHSRLTSAIIDFCLLTVTILTTKKSGDFISRFNLSMRLMENVLKFRNHELMDRLPPYLLQFRMLLKELCSRSDSNMVLELNDEQKIANCGHTLEQLTKNLVNNSKDMSRISMYLVADILGQYELNNLFPSVKKHLNNCIYLLISLCDQHAVQYLMRILSPTSTELFKMMYENYKKFYMFRGKV